jgi:hypothetical protein
MYPRRINTLRSPLFHYSELFDLLPQQVDTDLFVSSAISDEKTRPTNLHHLGFLVFRQAYMPERPLIDD